MNILDEGYSHLTSIVNAVEEKIRQLNGSREQSRKFPRRDVTLDEDDFRDVHINMIAGSDLINKVCSLIAQAVYLLAALAPV